MSISLMKIPSADITLSGVSIILRPRSQNIQLAPAAPPTISYTWFTSNPAFSANVSASAAATMCTPANS
eukprot:CAMPEP_0201609950 /NCGR_PEP_ID=MMETSP0492-20130828/15327_1 /ASSEMBLY_ACC=CAM_ASM_000837 /TAXON_ID=420259 /ORGANISM="Thalassiosira gravida, Strain GMp14c1" /LENGTH=68 /DNA_ID=CAMNT_0048075595 /DNA_START=112 /DNA_END=318 /DNA_ORIENTATION=+